MKTARQTADALEAFHERYGQVIANALSMYAEEMRKAADQALIGSALPEQPDPEPREGAISLRPTPAAFGHMHVMFTEAADRADAARLAYETLTEGDDENEEI